MIDFDVGTSDGTSIGIALEPAGGPGRSRADPDPASRRPAQSMREDVLTTEAPQMHFRRTAVSDYELGGETIKAEPLPPGFPADTRRDTRMPA
jgi:hypothetical protein